jgi:rhamnosyltransferase subunit B
LGQGKSDPKCIVIATIGSLGDLHPCLSLALELARRNHRVTIASTEYYRNKVEESGIRFYPIRPNWNPTDREIIRQCEDLKRGPEILYRKLILPHLRATYDDLRSAAVDADLMIAGELVYAAPLVSESLGLRWVSVILSPFSFFSSHDPSVMVSVPGLMRLRGAGWRVYRAGLNVCRLATRHWSNPVRRLRRELGLRTQCDPVFRDKFSPDLVLALFSRVLAQPQPDWPPQTVQPGFVYYDRQPTTTEGLAELERFLAYGDAPLVFTQGSTAAHNPGDFYEVSAEVARLLRRRAVLIGGSEFSREQKTDILAIRYVDYSKVFPHAAAIVHQGGSGTTGQALRAGRPTLIVPYGWDQPDNAARVHRLGTGLWLERTDYSAGTAVAALQTLLGNPLFASRALEVKAQLQKEDGLNGACDAIQTILTGTEIQDRATSAGRY